MTAAHSTTSSEDRTRTCYDSIGQLTNADGTLNGEDRAYAYDAAWNLTNRSGSSYSVDNKNELTNAPGIVGTMSYDANGNLISSSGDRYQYAYDDENQLIQRLDNGYGVLYPPKLTQFAYDGKNRLRVRLEYTYVCSEPESPAPIDPETDLPQPVCDWVLDSETHYIYDGMRVIQERDGSNTPLVSYTRGTDLSGSPEGAGGIGGLLARSDGYSSGNFTSHTFYHADGNGNVTYLADGSQALAASYRYDPFGNILAASGSLAGPNVYRFSSKELLGNTGMYYYGYRFYDPNLQRWINRDPIREKGFSITQSFKSRADFDDINSYGFVRNGAVNAVDGLGLSTVPTGVKKCNQGKRDNFHGFITVDGQAYGFYPTDPSICGVTWGRGTVEADDPGAAKCKEIKLDDCWFDIDDFKQCVKNRVKGDIQNPPRYSVFLNNCRQWRNDVIDECIFTSNKRGFWSGQMEMW